MCISSNIFILYFEKCFALTWYTYFVSGIILGTIYVSNYLRTIMSGRYDFPLHFAEEQPEAQRN